MRKSVFLCLIIINLFVLPSLFPSMPSYTPIRVQASEEENIDSFDVSPNSGRWEVDSNTLTDDFVADSELNMITVNNETSGSGEYMMNRGTTSTDGKVEFRAKSSGADNQTEYFRDILGDSCDFAEGDDEDLTGLVSQTVESGIFSAGFTSTADDLIYDDILISSVVYSVVNIRLKVFSVSTTISFQIYASNTLTGTSAPVSSVNVLSADWENYEVDVSLDSDWKSTIDKIFFRFRKASTFDVSDKVYLDYFKIIGDLDYASHVKGEVEDTWDWEDSVEYFHREEDNISDFNDGSLEGWTNKLGGGIENDDGWLKVERSGTSLYINISSLSIDADVYKWFTFECIINSSNANIYLNTITIYDDGSSQVAQDTTNYEQNVPFLFSKNLDDDADWSGTETGFTVKLDFNSSTMNYAYFNFTFVYDSALGDREGWIGLSNYYTNPQGYLALMGQGSTPVVASLSQVIDSDIFSTVKLRAMSLEGSYIRIKGEQSGQKVLSSIINLDAGVWVEETVDLSIDSDWTGIFDWVGIELNEFSFGETILIDYFLILGEWSDSDSTIGLFDDETSEPLLNMSLHHSGETTCFELELMDSSGEIAYNYTSTNTQLNNTWIVGKLSFDVLRSTIALTLSFENTTRIFKIAYPGDFTEQSGRIPALFALERSPDIFVSSYCQPLSWQYFTIDYIKADYKENEWTMQTAKTDADWVESSWDTAVCTDEVVTDSANFSMVVPYFDSVSGTLGFTSETSNFASIHGGLVYMIVYGVDADDGELHELLSVANGVYDQGAGDLTWQGIYDNSGNRYLHTTAYTGAEQPSLDFSISTSNDRRNITIKMRCYPDEADTDVFEDFIYTQQIDYSQEFVLETYYWVNINAGEDITLSILDFSLLERNIFEDLIQGVVAPIGNFITEFFAGVFRFLAGIFKTVGDILGAAILIAQNAVTAAMDVLKGVLDNIKGVIDSISSTLTTVLTEIQGLAADVATAIWTGVGDALDFITDAITDVATDVIDALIAQIGSVIDDAITWLIAVATDLADLVFDVIDLLLDLLLTVVSELWALFEGVVFFIWDALSLPDLLSVGDALLVGFGQLIGAVPQFITDMGDLITNIFTISIWGGLLVFFGLPITIAPTPGQWIEKVMEFLGFDVAFGWTILGVGGHVPAGGVWLVFVIGSGILSASLVGGFF